MNVSLLDICGLINLDDGELNKENGADKCYSCAFSSGHSVQLSFLSAAAQASRASGSSSDGTPEHWRPRSTRLSAR